MEKRIGFIGFGNIAQAVARGLTATGACAAERLCACAAHFDRLQKNAAALGVRAFERAEDVVSWSDFVVLAVKPYMVEAVLAPLREPLADKVLISVASGYDFAAYEKLLSPETRHISAIPNTPIAVGEGIMICEDRHSLRAEEMADFEAVFGRVAMLESVPARLFSIAGTLSGCTPAYTAHVSGSPCRRGRQARSARAHGLSRRRQDALRHRQTLSGNRNAPGAMKDAVCSPGGTTIRGVAALDGGGFRAAVPRRHRRGGRGSVARGVSQRRPSAFLFC